MKILIVDDEELTRKGLITLIPWHILGIQTVLSAKDGLIGLDIFTREHPEIVLCDLRMPRMDGVTLAENIRAISPDTSIIFMSGYSDKEYLKAAIRLKAISYVDKPIKPGDVESAVHEAILHYKERTQINLHELSNRHANQALLAYLLTTPGETNHDQILALSEELLSSAPEELSFVTYLAKPVFDMNISESYFQPALLNIQDALLSYGYSMISAPRNDFFVFHIYGSIIPHQDLLDKFDHLIADEFQRAGMFYLSRGECVSGCSQVSHSYLTAACLLQSCFFFCADRVLTQELTDNTISAQELEDAFSKTPPVLTYSSLLKTGSEADMTDFLEHLYSLFQHSLSLLSDQAKDLYYQLFSVLSSDPASDFDFTPYRSLMSYIGQFADYTLLHNDLLQNTLHLMKYRTADAQQKDTIAQIKGYILQHFADPSLSVKDISEHVYLSASYVCTIFKTETGHTLNQYITEYRIKQAKELLLDSSYKITDISSAVGYSDGNYFAKSFRKITGISPSEYREKYGQNM